MSLWITLHARAQSHQKNKGLPQIVAKTLEALNWLKCLLRHWENPSLELRGLAWTLINSPRSVALLHQTYSQHSNRWSSLGIHETQICPSVSVISPKNTFPLFQSPVAVYLTALRPMLGTMHGDVSFVSRCLRRNTCHEAPDSQFVCCCCVQVIDVPQHPSQNVCGLLLFFWQGCSCPRGVSSWQSQNNWPGQISAQSPGQNVQCRFLQTIDMYMYVRMYDRLCWHF